MLKNTESCVIVFLLVKKKVSQYYYTSDHFTGVYQQSLFILFLSTKQFITVWPTCPSYLKKYQQINALCQIVKKVSQSQSFRASARGVHASHRFGVLACPISNDPYHQYTT